MLPQTVDLSLFLFFALSEVGVAELPGPNHNDRILEYHSTTGLDAETDEVAWCSSFVNWVVQQAGAEGTNSAAARSWVTWGKRSRKFIPGCVSVFSRGKNDDQGHVGIGLYETPKSIVVVSGNLDNKVRISTFPKYRWIGCRIPKN